LILAHTKTSERISCIGRLSTSCSQPEQLGLYTILPSPLLCGMHCNTGWSGENTVLRNRVRDAGETRGLFANNGIDSRAKASNETNILPRPTSNPISNSQQTTDEVGRSLTSSQFYFRNFSVGLFSSMPLCECEMW